MKLTTLNRLMQPMEESKLIVQRSIGESTGGRKPVRYDVNSKYFYFLGVDLSRTYTQLVLSNLKMDILFQYKFEMNESLTPEKTITKIRDIFNTAIIELGISKEAVLGAGVGTVGPLDRDKGQILNPSFFNSAGWSNVSICEMLKAQLELPVFLDNGANTAVLSEFLFGDGKKFKNIAYINCGIGIRTGAISSETIVRTMHDAEDAFGHMIIDIDGEPCYCGNYGCIECYSSIHAITRNFISALKRGKMTAVNKSINEISYIDILSAAENNDELAREIVTDAAITFGAGLMNYINLLNPGMVILSGPIISNSNLFYDISTERASRALKTQKVIFIKGGHFGESAIALGAAALVVEKFLNSRIAI